MNTRPIFTLVICFFLSLSSFGQSRISRVVSNNYTPEKFSKNSQTKNIHRDINHRDMESKLIGKTALPSVYKFKSERMYLNGAGLREIFWVDLYACGLYLSEKSSNPIKIVGADEPMVLRLDILSNIISKEKLIKAVKDGFNKSNTEQMAEEFNSDLNKFISFLDIKVYAGDKYDIVYMPGVGTTLYVNYIHKGTIKGLAFKSALYNIWLSKEPANKKLKEQLINKV